MIWIADRYFPPIYKGLFDAWWGGFEAEGYFGCRKDFGKAIEIDRYDADTWASRAILRLQQQRYKDAEADLDHAIRLSTRNSGVYINRALARYHQNNLRGAMSDYDIALDIDP